MNDRNHLEINTTPKRKRNRVQISPIVKYKILRQAKNSAERELLNEQLQEYTVPMETN